MFEWKKATLEWRKSSFDVKAQSCKIEKVYEKVSELLSDPGDLAVLSLRIPHDVNAQKATE